MRLTKGEIIQKFWDEAEKYAPLKYQRMLQETQDISPDISVGTYIDFCIADGPCFKAIVEAEAVATPKIISQAAQQLTAYLNRIDNKNIVPVIIVPYMGTEQARILQQESISWIDLCGNMVIRVRNRMYIERTGQKNQFPDTSPIKKIFEGTSSLVSRALLLTKEPFRSLYEVVNFINERDGYITLSTVSKVLSLLEEGLLITKTEAGISVTNREKLLDSVLEGYVSYMKRNKNRTFTFSIKNLNDLFTVFGERKTDYAICGFYAAKLKGLATTDRISIFISSIDEAKKATELGCPKNINPDTEFGQLDFIETKNPCVWFNLQGDDFNKVIDDIELYLEMMIDTPRGPKVAEILKERILKGQE
jgi:hypothetical protein